MEPTVQSLAAERVKYKRANRRLALAAPAMLHALKLAGTQLDTILNGQGALDVDAIDHALMAVNAAILRAEGRG